MTNPPIPPNRRGVLAGNPASPPRRIEEFPRAPGVPPPPPPEDDDDLDVDEPEGRGFSFFLAAVVLSILIVIGGFYGLQQVVEKGYVDQLVYIFKETELLPNRTLKSAATNDSLQIFMVKDGMTLTPHVRRLRRNTSGSEKAHLILRELFTPSQSSLFYSTIPNGTRMRGFYHVGRVAYLDLTQEFLKPEEPSPRGERLAVYSLVNSIVLNVPDIDALQILVEGSPIDSAWGWLDCSSALGADLSLIR